MRAYRFILGLLTVWRITHLLHAEDGPWDIVVRLRRAAGNGFWGKLLDCFYCLSLWSAVPLALLLGRTWWNALYCGPRFQRALAFWNKRRILNLELHRQHCRRSRRGKSSWHVAGKKDNRLAGRRRSAAESSGFTEEFKPPAGTTSNHNFSIRWETALTAVDLCPVGITDLVIPGLSLRSIPGTGHP